MKKIFYFILVGVTFFSCKKSDEIFIENENTATLADSLTIYLLTFRVQDVLILNK
jgi:hypothetical protein